MAHKTIRKNKRAAKAAECFPRPLGKLRPKAMVKPASFNSAIEKPLPIFTLVLYLLVCPMTIGLSLPRGLGKHSAALAALLFFLIDLCAILLKKHLTPT